MMPKLYEENDRFGEQQVYRFDNGYGASVVRGEFTYGGDRGLFELAVLRFEGAGDRDWGITYDTPITDDVLGYLDRVDVERILSDIEKLPESPEEAHGKPGEK